MKCYLFLVATLIVVATKGEGDDKRRKVYHVGSSVEAETESNSRGASHIRPPPLRSNSNNRHLLSSHLHHQINSELFLAENEEEMMRELGSYVGSIAKPPSGEGSKSKGVSSA